MGFGLNVLGMAAGYKGYKDELKDQEDIARRAAADEQLALDNAYLAEKRSRERYDWSEIDRMRGNTKNDAAEYWRQRLPDGASPEAGGGSAATAAAPAAAPATMTDSSALPTPPDGRQPTPIDADLAGAPSARALPSGAGQPLPQQSVPVDADLAGAPPPRALASTAQGDPGQPVRQPVPLDADLAGAPPARALSAAASAATPAPAAPTAPPVASPASQPAAAAAVVPAAAGIPPPRQFGTVLGMQTYMLNQAAKRGDVPLEAYAQARGLLDKMRYEGITQALDAFARGDYQGGIDAYNNNGINNGAKFVSAQDATTTLPNGQQAPTRIVTLRTPNGDVVIDTARDRYMMLGLEKQVDLMDKATKTKAEAEYHGALGAAATKNAETNAKWLEDRARIGDDANLVRALTGAGRGAAGAGKADAKALKDALELNAHLYSYKPDPDKKEVEIPAAKSLYGNLIMRSGDPDKAYRVMAAFRTEALAEALAGAVDPKTKAVDPALVPARFLAAYSAKIASADAELHKAAAQAAQAAGATAGAPSDKPGTKPGAKPPAPEAPRVLPSANTLAERDKQMAVFNQTVGGGQDRARFEAAMAARRQDVAANFNKYLAALRPGMPRADAQKVLAWVADQTEAGTLSNRQLKAVRDARHAARL